MRRAAPNESKGEHQQGVASPLPAAPVRVSEARSGADDSTVAATATAASRRSGSRAPRAREGVAQGGGSVRLVVNARGDVVSVVDQGTNKDIPYTIAMSWDDAEDTPALFEALQAKVSTTLHGGCSRTCSHCSGTGCLLGVQRAALVIWKRNASSCVVFLPLFNCRLETGASPMRFPTGCAYVLPSNSIPSGTFFPFNPTDYCTGVSLVEIENKLDDRGLMLTPDYFVTHDAHERRNTFIALAYGSTDPDALPGVILHDTVKDLQPFTSSKYPRDPLLRTFRPDWAPNGVRLGSDDFCFIGVSNWAEANASTREVAGHANGQVHFYLVVKYSLPPEVCDQLAHVLLANPKKDTWKTFSERKMFERTHALAERIREHFISMALREMGLQPKKSTPDVVHTNWNVLDSTPIQVRAASADESVATGVCYYSGCTPTHRAKRGVVVPRGDVDAGCLWFSGDPSGFVGGRAWKQPQSVSAFPCTLGAEQKWTRREMKLLEDGGWDPTNGYIKIDSLVKLKA